jgi:hypothetical protein
MNYLLLIIVGGLTLALIIWLTYTTIKDRKDLEKSMNEPTKDVRHQRGKRE